MTRDWRELHRERPIWNIAQNLRLLKVRRRRRTQRRMRRNATRVAAERTHPDGRTNRADRSRRTHDDHRYFCVFGHDHEHNRLLDELRVAVEVLDYDLLERARVPRPKLASSRTTSGHTTRARERSREKPSGRDERRVGHSETNKPRSDHPALLEIIAVRACAQANYNSR